MTVWNIEEVTGYKPKTTFWEDFSIADSFGAAAVLDTYSRAFKCWKDSYIYLTELVLVLNWKIWQWHDHNKTLASIYDRLWSEANDYAWEHLAGEELSYFYQTTD